MIPDSSVLVAGAEPDHVFFEPATSALADVRKRGRLAAHAAAEAFSVLTRARMQTPDAALEYLRQFLARSPVGVPPASYVKTIEQLAARGVSGGAIYDGLIAVAAREAGETLLSFDRRAAATYERVGVDFKLLPDER